MDKVDEWLKAQSKTNKRALKAITNLRVGLELADHAKLVEDQILHARILRMLDQATNLDEEPDTQERQNDRREQDDDRNAGTYKISSKSETEDKMSAAETHNNLWRQRNWSPWHTHSKCLNSPERSHAHKQAHKGENKHHKAAERDTYVFETKSETPVRLMHTTSQHNDDQEDYIAPLEAPEQVESTRAFHAVQPVHPDPRYRSASSRRRRIGGN